MRRNTHPSQHTHRKVTSLLLFPKWILCWRKMTDLCLGEKSLYQWLLLSKHGIIPLEQLQPPHPPAQRLCLSRAGSAWWGRLVVHSPGLFWKLAASCSLSPPGGDFAVLLHVRARECFRWKSALLTSTGRWNQRTTKGPWRNLCAALVPWKQILVYPTYSESASTLATPWTVFVHYSSQSRQF